MPLNSSSPSRLRKTETGDATFYYATGNLTASGEPYVETDFTCGHKTLPFGTFILVEYKSNHVYVRVNDRIPLTARSSLDLTPTAFDRLAPSSVGRIKVSYSYLQ